MLSLSDLSPYPRAASSVLDFPEARLQADEQPYKMQIEGDIFAVWFESSRFNDPEDGEEEIHPGSLWLWNYIEGTLIAVSLQVHRQCQLIGLVTSF